LYEAAASSKVRCEKGADVHLTLLSGDCRGLSVAGPSLLALGGVLVGMVLWQMVRGRGRAETFRLWFFIGLLLRGTHLALHDVL
jgi:hypothetical protein